MKKILSLSLSPECFYRMNNLHFALADYQQAQALDLEPTNWDVSCRIAVVHCELGIDLFSKDSYEKAEKQFTAALQHNPKVSRLYPCRARARKELKASCSSFQFPGTFQPIMFNNVDHFSFFKHWVEVVDIITITRIYTGF